MADGAADGAEGTGGVVRSGCRAGAVAVGRGELLVRLVPDEVNLGLGGSGGGRGRDNDRG